jgi:hypothetical protein
VIRIEAMMQKTPSQMFSAEPHTSRASVYQIAMKAAPRHIQIPKPSKAPNQIYMDKRCKKKEDLPDKTFSQRKVIVPD